MLDQSKSNDNFVPMAKIVHPAEWSGRFNKHLIVPPARQGIVIHPDGSSLILNEGKTRILSFWQRLNGAGIGLQTGFFSPYPFTSIMISNYLLTGNGILIDAHVVLSVYVADPARFYYECLLPSNEIAIGGMTRIGNEMVQSAIASVVRCYTAADLIAGMYPQIIVELQDILQPVLRNTGLEIDCVEIVSFWRSDERAEIAEKVHDLEERLQEIELQKEFAQIESKVQLQEFIDQIDPDLMAKMGFYPAEKAVQDSNVINFSLSRWLASLIRKPSNDKGQPEVHWRIHDLLKKKGKDLKPDETYSHDYPRPPRSWWRVRVGLILLLLLLGYGLTRLTFDIGGGASIELKLGIVSAIWLAILPIIIESLRWIVEKKEEIVFIENHLPITVRLERQIGRDPEKIDLWVRQQSQQDLHQAAGLLQDIRYRLYKESNSKAALAARDLERKFLSSGEKILSNDFGAPMYLKGNRLNGQNFDRFLDYDEELLLYSSALCDIVFSVQKSFTDLERKDTILVDLEANLDEYMHKFAGRGRLVQPR
jgi:hypothetical protein